jgi:hypothetical protein
MCARKSVPDPFYSVDDREHCFWNSALPTSTIDPDHLIGNSEILGGIWGMEMGGRDAALDARITAQRFENKYAVCEMQALAIRDYIAAHTTADPHAGSQGDYSVTSLYFDGPQLKTVLSSEHGERNRYKIRARNYGAGRRDSVYCEIKRRNNQVLRKHRVRLEPAEATDLFVRNRESDSLTRLSPEESRQFFIFRDLMDRQVATPRVLVRYRREARLSTDGMPVRITFDRNLECRPCFTYGEEIWLARGSWYRVSNLDVALEVKFTESFPGWLDRMVKRFHLRARSICKYALCVHELNRHGVRVGGTGLNARVA